MRTLEHINAELSALGLLNPPASFFSPWPSSQEDFEEAEADREAERRHRLCVEIEEWCERQSIERIKCEFNPAFAKVGLHLVRLPRRHT